MTHPRRELIVQAFVAALRAGLPGVTVERNRDVPVNRFPAIVVYTAGHQVARLGPGIDEYRLSVVAEGYVVDRDGERAAEKLNDLYARTVAAMTGDPTLGGLADDVREESLGEDYSDEATQRYGHFELSFEVLYATAAGDPFS